MTDQPFKASNGLVISEIDEGDYLVTSPSGVEINVDPWQSFALREFFQHQRDQQLGRVRWPEDPGKGPERPWEEAKEGEVWRLTVEGCEGNALVDEAPSGNLYFYSIKDTTPLRYAGITAGRKLVNADGSLADE